MEKCITILEMFQMSFFLSLALGLFADGLRELFYVEYNKSVLASVCSAERTG